MRTTIVLLAMPVLLFFTGMVWFAALWTRHQ